MRQSFRVSASTCVEQEHNVDTQSEVDAEYLLYLWEEVGDTSFRVIQFHTSLLHYIGPVARVTLCGSFVDKEREYLATPVQLKHIDARNC